MGQLHAAVAGHAPADHRHRDGATSADHAPSSLVVVPVIVYIAIVEDRHTNTEVYPFSIAEAAIDFARETARQYARTEADVEETPIDGWLYHATYSTEGDSVRVVAKDLDL